MCKAALEGATQEIPLALETRNIVMDEDAGKERVVRPWEVVAITSGLCNLEVIANNYKGDTQPSSIPSWTDFKL